MIDLGDALSAALIIMMFAMGLGLRGEDFKRLVVAPRLLLITLLGQLMLLPLLALAIALLTHVTPAIALGLLLVALCPSGSTSNFFCKLGQGNAALSVSLTAVISLITVFSLPLVLLTVAPLIGYSFSAGVTLSLLDTIRDVGLHTLLPVVVGMCFRQFAAHWSVRAEPVVVLLSTVFFALVIVMLWVENAAHILTSFTHTGMVTVLLLTLALMLGFGLAYMLNASAADRFTIMLEVGIQNGALAFFIAVNLLKDLALIGPATVYTVAMILFAVPIVLWRRRSLE